MAVLQVARVVENLSEHPIAQAVVNYVDKQPDSNAAALQTSDFEATPGQGVQACVTSGTTAAAKSNVLIGNRMWLASNGVRVLPLLVLPSVLVLMLSAIASVCGLVLVLPLNLHVLPLLVLMLPLVLFLVTQ